MDYFSPILISDVLKGLTRGYYIYSHIYAGFWIKQSKYNKPKEPILFSAEHERNGLQMVELRQLFNKQVPVLTAISIALSALIIYWMFNRYAPYFYTTLFALLAASAGMLIYLAIAWRSLTRTDRYSIGFSIMMCLFMIYGVIHANGLTLVVLLTNS